MRCDQLHYNTSRPGRREMAHDHHEHDHDDPHTAPLTETQLKVKALESLLIDKGLVDPKALDELIDTYETKVGPRNGARVVAKAWVDPAYKQRLLANGGAAIDELGYRGRQGEDIVVLRTRRRFTTSSSARCAPAIRGRCSGCRRSGTSRRRIARAPSSIRAACSASSA